MTKEGVNKWWNELVALKLVKMNGCSIESSTLYNSLEGAEAYRTRNIKGGFGEREIIHMVEAV
jgi:hypothetical protein